MLLRNLYIEQKDEENMETFLSITNESLREAKPPYSQRNRMRKVGITQNSANVSIMINGKTARSRWKNVL